MYPKIIALARHLPDGAIRVWLLPKVIALALTRTVLSILAFATRTPSNYIPLEAQAHSNLYSTPHKVSDLRGGGTTDQHDVRGVL